MRDKVITIKLVITCCGECPYFNAHQDECKMGAKDYDNEAFFNDCPFKDEEE